MRYTRHNVLLLAAVVLTACGGDIGTAERSAGTAAPRMHSHPAALSYNGLRKPLLVQPKAVRDRVQQLNQTLEACLAAHGVARVDLAEGGYMYQSNTRVDAACAKHANAIDTYINSDAYHANDAVVLRLLKQFWDCFD